jgi:secreted trypsin-like serine protease
VVAKLGKESGSCSGVVVSAHVVVTAGHCIDPTFKYSIFLGADYNDPNARALADNSVAVSEVHAHPKYNPTLNENDIGVLITAMPIPRTPATINRQPLAKSDIGQAIRIVGYGETAGNSGVYGRRHQGTSTIGTFDPTTISLTGLPNNICLFDSGGPAFLNRGGTEVVAGIHVMVDSTACDGGSLDTRVDAYADFIDGYVNAIDPPNDAGPAADASTGNDAPTGAEVSSPSAESPARSSQSGCAIGASPRRTASVMFSMLFAAIALFRRRRAKSNPRMPIHRPAPREL